MVSYIGMKAFAIMKFVAPLVNVIAFWILASKDFEKKGYKFMNVRDVLKTVIPTVVIVFFSTWLFRHWMIEEQTKGALLTNLLLIGVSTIFSMCAAIPFNCEMRSELSRCWNSITKYKIKSYQ